MASVTAIRSVSLGVSDLDESVRFFTETWGLQEVDRADGAVYLRGTGSYHHILALRASEREEVISGDLLAASWADVDAIHQRIVATGVTSTAPARITAPGGGYGFSFKDLDGRTMRVIAEDERYEPVDDQPDRPSRLMHVVMNAIDKDATSTFYCDALGFTISNAIKPATFLKCNDDHHALAFFRSDATTLNHIAFKMQDAAAVSRGAERMLSRGYAMGWGLGRHTIEVYAYFEGPRRLPIEYITVVGEDWKADDRLPHWETFPERTPELNAAMARVPFQSGSLELAI
jgi:catechol-2,3-dioxygenase